MYNGSANIYLDAKIECLRMSQKQLKIKEPPGSSLCCIVKQTCHVLRHSGMNVHIFSFGLTESID